MYSGRHHWGQGQDDHCPVKRLRREMVVSILGHLPERPGTSEPGQARQLALANDALQPPLKVTAYPWPHLS